MKFGRYARGSVVATEEGRGLIALRTLRDGAGGLLRTRDGVPTVVIQIADAFDVAAVLDCIARDCDRDECATLGVEVEE